MGNNQQHHAVKINGREVHMYIVSGGSRASIWAYDRQVETIHSEPHNGHIGLATWGEGTPPSSIEVHADYRNSGVALKMLEMAEEAIRAKAAVATTFSSVSSDLTCSGAHLLNRFAAVHHPVWPTVQPRPDRIRTCKRGSQCAFYGEGHPE